MTPDQELYSEIYRKAEGLGYTVYPFNPDPGTAYPYVKLGMLQVIPTVTKSYLLGTVYGTFDVWGDGSNRTIIAEMAQKLLYEMSRIKSTKDGLSWSMNLGETSTEIMTDDTTNENLWRARVSFRMNFM